jgi:hypothetical protein
MHDYHEGRKGYSPEQVLHDGCGECEARSKEFDGGFAHLDRFNAVRAWERAARWNRDGLADLAHAEIPMFRILWSVQLKLEQVGHHPIGVFPYA